MTEKPVILVVDDEESQRALLRAVLRDSGYVVHEAGSGEEAIAAVRKQTVDLILIDLRMPGMDGLETLLAIKTIRPGVPILIMTAYATVQTAVTAMKQGAFDYLMKPLDLEELRLTVQKTLNHQELIRENLELKRHFESLLSRPIVIGASSSMAEVFKLLELAAPTDVTVLLTGESGTGKGMIAELIHRMSHRREHLFVKVNCGVLTESLLESELFGIEKRVATGVDERVGKFEYAHRGTIFLDEVEEMPSKLQVKLLRVLQEKEFERVGGNATITADVRIVAATNQDPEEQVRVNKLREDLYYRLNVMPIRMPPLRERIEDIEPLALHFLRHSAAKIEKAVKGIAPSTLSILQRYHWPGNVRELMNIMERAVILTKFENIMPLDLPMALQKLISQPEETLSAAPDMSIRAAERQLVIKSLETTSGNRTEAAKILGISRRTLLNKLKEYGIQP